MIAFQTNFDTVHRRCCRKRDEENDFSEFHKVQQSQLWKRVHDELRKEFARSPFWFVPDDVELHEDGTCRVVVRYCHMDERHDDDKHRRTTVVFRFCKPEEVAAKVAQERKFLG
jgi:hypothetical protein